MGGFPGLGPHKDQKANLSHFRWADVPFHYPQWREWPVMACRGGVCRQYNGRRNYENAPSTEVFELY